MFIISFCNEYHGYAETFREAELYVLRQSEKLGIVQTGKPFCSELISIDSRFDVFPIPTVRRAWSYNSWRIVEDQDPV